MGGSRLDLRVMPRSPRTALAGIRDGRLVVRVTAAPVDDAANEAVVRALADALNVPRTSIRLVNGAHSRNKTVEVAGLDAGELQQRIASLGLSRT
jgi:uncharacterized protein YggU (UPF0235/DUF167 family)